MTVLTHKITTNNYSKLPLLIREQMQANAEFNLAALNSKQLGCGRQKAGIIPGALLEDISRYFCSLQIHQERKFQPAFPAKGHSGPDYLRLSNCPSCGLRCR